MKDYKSLSVVAPRSQRRMQSAVEGDNLLEKPRQTGPRVAYRVLPERGEKSWVSQ